MNILAFAGSNSSWSINKDLVSYAASHFESSEILDLNDYETAIFSKDREKESGIPDKVKAFSDQIKAADAIVMSLAEYNGAYTSAFKNLFDWLSRISGRSVFMDKPILLMAASTGKRGGKSVLEIAEKRFPFNGGKVLATYSFPNFNDNFDTSTGKITNEDLDQQLKETIADFKEQLKEELVK